MVRRTHASLSKALTKDQNRPDYWAREFESLQGRMQSQKARRAVDALFSATDAELNRRDT